MKNYNVDDSLNVAAASWARANRAGFPLDNRPLLRPESEIQLNEVEP